MKTDEVEDAQIIYQQAIAKAKAVYFDVLPSKFLIPDVNGIRLLRLI